jgi:hypothetical protein
MNANHREWTTVRRIQRAARSSPLFVVLRPAPVGAAECSRGGSGVSRQASGAEPPEPVALTSLPPPAFRGEGRGRANGARLSIARELRTVTSFQVLVGRTTSNVILKNGSMSCCTERLVVKLFAAATF